MLSVFIAPVASPLSKPSLPALPPHLDALDKRLVEILGEEGESLIMSLLNSHVIEQNPESRQEGRQLWREAWSNLRRLLRLRVIFRVGRKAVSLHPPPSQPLAPRRRRKSWRASSPTVSPFSALHVGSTSNGAITEPPSIPVQIEEPHVPANKFGRSALQQPQQEIKSVPSREEISVAASSLARRPRNQRRRWTGWIGKIHAYRNMPILLPNGERAVVFGVLRRKVVWSLTENYLAGGIIGAGLNWGVLPMSDVRISRNFNAQLLGARKAGVREKPSLPKAHAARLNGKRPCHAGRRRGRPRKPWRRTAASLLVVIRSRIMRNFGA